LCQDATSLVLPLELIVLYLYNPFDETLMINVANEFLVSLSNHPRPAVLVYYNPACRHLFEAAGQMRLLHYERLHDKCCMPAAPGGRWVGHSISRRSGIIWRQNE